KTLGDPVIIQTKRRPHMHRQTIDIVALQTTVLQRLLEGSGAKAKLALRQEAPEFRRPHTDDCGIQFHSEISWIGEVPVNPGRSTTRPIAAPDSTSRWASAAALSGSSRSTIGRIWPRATS